MSKVDNEYIGDYIAHIFSTRWKELCVVDGISGQQLSYESLFSLILKGRDHLKLITKDKEKKVALILDNSIELLVLYFSALIEGVVVIPIDPLKGDREINEILEEGNCKIALISQSRLKEPIEGVSYHHYEDLKEILGKVEKAELSHLDIFHSLDYQSLFSISFTSGTTGTPKGVMHSYANLFQTALAFKASFKFSSKNTFYHNLPMTYMAGMLNLIFLPFLSESKIVIGQRYSVAAILNFWELPIKYQVNTFFFIPTIVTMLLKFDRGDQGAKYTRENEITACIGTAPLNPQIQQEFESKYQTKLYESYGLSETLFTSTNAPEFGKVKGVGKPLLGIELDFKDKEILIKAPWNFMGYYNLEADKFFIEDKFISGDLGELDADNFLRITGRKKDIIIRGGINISPRRIEDLLSTENIFEECVVLGIEDLTLGEKTVCVFTAAAELPKGIKKQVNKIIANALGKSYVIDELKQVPELSKNINGKIDKLRIKKLYLSDQ